MGKAKNQKCVIYIGDFDLRNQNVQSHLVKNNAKILNSLGYKVAFIGENREANYETIESLPKLDVGGGNLFLELENTLSLKGLLSYSKTSKRILSFMDEVANKADVEYVISYQAPTYAPILKRIALWCRNNGAKYIVNSADIPILSSQPLLRRIVMTLNWDYLHRINKKYADGIIAVSRYIENFYHKDGLPSIIIPPLFDDYDDNDYVLADITTFVYAGTPFIMKKNVSTVGMKDRLDKIIELCLRLSEDGTKYRLLVIGITKDMYTTCIPRHKRAISQNTDIQFMGRYSHQDTLSAVRNSDYMINIRDVNKMNEAGLSTKLVESVSLGTPVIMNSVGDSFLYLREGITGYELSGNLENDVELIKTLCDKSKKERLALKLQCAGDKSFSLEKFKIKLDCFLNEVASK